VNHYHFYDDGILYRYAEKEVFVYVSKPEVVWHLVSRPCGVALSVAPFRTGQGAETPLPLFLGNVIAPSLPIPSPQALESTPPLSLKDVGETA